MAGPTRILLGACGEDEIRSVPGQRYETPCIRDSSVMSHKLQ
jgi:hypothetical protein